MLNQFDWLRRSNTGAELLATLQYLETDFAGKQGSRGAEERDSQKDVSSASLPSRPFAPLLLGPPPSALTGPCLRCWVYPRAETQRHALYCDTCHTILNAAVRLRERSRRAIVIWGLVNQLPQQLRHDAGWHSRILGLYVHDDHHFLAMLHYRELQSWLQEIAIYHGADLKGLLQVCPSTGGPDHHMGELLCRMIHNEARFPIDRLRVRFFASPHQVFDPQLYERMGVLTFDVSEFLRMLDMAVVFRSLLPPDEQRILHALLKNDDASEEQFYWGRFLGCITRQAKDMLSAWRIRQWSKAQVDLLYELAEYVGFYQTR